MAESEMTGNKSHFLSEAINDFGLTLHLKLAQEAKNVFFSPFSISVALSMLLRGAKEETADEIKQVLSFKSLNVSDEKVHLSFCRLLDMIMQNQDCYTLAIANAIVSHRDFLLLPEYKEDLQKIYKALTMEVDFMSESDRAVKEINEWVGKSTRGKITNLLSTLDASTVMVLLNAVYFKGTWEHQFNREETHDGLFYNKGVKDKAKSIPFMHAERTLSFVDNQHYKALELPYKGNDIAMILFLPEEMQGIQDLEKNLTPQFIQTTRKALNEVKVKVFLPKFHLEYTKELKPFLMELGMRKVFEPVANLKGLSESDKLMASKVIHKSVLDVNEEGSEATAVTAVQMRMRCLRLNPQFKANHPFLFVIYDRRNNMIYFMGRVEEL